MADSASTGSGEDAGPVPPARVGSTVWRRATSTAYVESPGRVVVLDLDHLALPPYVFEGSAAQVWARLDGVRSEAEVVADLVDAYDAPAELVTGDVRQFVDRLRDLGLIVSDLVG